MTTPTGPLALDRLTLKALRLEKEEAYWAVMLVITISSALVLILLSPLLLLAAFVLVCAKQLFLAHIRGNGVKITDQQFPELQARIKAASARLGLARPPEAYVIEAGGTLNAFATKLFGRNFVILYADLVEACGPDDKALDFVIGHEIGHIALGHLKWALWLLPGRLMPLLAQAYSRACEYSCDRCGLVVAGALEPATRGLLTLAAGRTLAARASASAFSQQAVAETKGFWAQVYEVTVTHPFLSKRVRALREFMAPGTEPAVARRFLPILCAPILGQPIAFAVVFGYLALVGGAVGVPAYLSHRKAAARSEAQEILGRCRDAQNAFHAKEGRYSLSFSELGLASVAAPEAYTLFMGDQQLGPNQAVPPGLRGFAATEFYACVAVRNLDDDDTFDVWVIDPSLEKPHLFIDDESEEVTNWRPEQDAQAEE